MSRGRLGFASADLDRLLIVIAGDFSKVESEKQSEGGIRGLQIELVSAVLKIEGRDTQFVRHVTAFFSVSASNQPDRHFDVWNRFPRVGRKYLKFYS